MRDLPPPPVISDRAEEEAALAAMALGLGHCAVGASDASMLARILASDCLTDSLVDEFVAGSGAVPRIGEARR